MNGILNNVKMELDEPSYHFQTHKVEHEEIGAAYEVADTEAKVQVEGIKANEVKEEKKDSTYIISKGRGIIPKRSCGAGLSISVSFQHKVRLRQFLKKLFRARRWKEAAGVLSTLLKGTCHCRLSLKNRRKYWAAMELLRRVDLLSGSSWKVQRLYDCWMYKQPAGNSELRKKRYLIQLEAALVSVIDAKVQQGFNITKFLVQEPECRKEPLVHMVHGMILYHMWYAGIPKDLQMSHIEPCDAIPSVDDTSFGPCDKSGPVKVPSSNNMVGEIKGKVLSGYNSDSSIGNLKDVQTGIKYEPPSKKRQGDLPKHKFYMDGSSEINESQDIHYTEDGDASGFSFADCGSHLLPIQIQKLLNDEIDPVHSCSLMVNEHHKNAVNHLRFAVSANPPTVAALLPLVQLLLLGGQVEDALEELRKFSLNSDHAIPSRIRAHLLGRVHIKNLALLSACHEDALKKNPTSRDSLIILIKLHKSGSYSMEKLLEMIALHLDAARGTCGVWEELAVLFLNIQMEHFYLEEDRFSSERIGVNNDRLPSFISSSTLPGIFSGKEQRKAWKLRCRWWFTRHFSKKIYLEEKLSGDVPLLTFKAASAAHLYGTSFGYVSSVEKHLEEHDQMASSRILRKHTEACLNLQNKFKGPMALQSVRRTITKGLHPQHS